MPTPSDIFTNPNNVNLIGQVTVVSDPITGSGGNLNLGGSLNGGVVAPTTSTGGTIAVSNARVVKATVAAGAQATNLTLASGLPGQELTVINENAVGGSTLVITGSVIVTSGTTTVTISGLAGAKFVFDNTQNLWVKL